MNDLSPAERYAAAKKRASHPLSEKFSSSIDFPLDDFQIQGIHAVESGSGVLVAAPTGAGKTIVGEFAAFLAMHFGKKCFYTTPIKALSNQKFQDLKAVHGDSSVGLLTGDTSINPDALIVVMTTEVLRNMIYSRSHSLKDLGYVVMDEVHYLADKFRGAVWEEILIHLPEHIQVISLSATVSNAEEFGEWLNIVRGSTEIIVSEHRPVPLYQHLLFGNRLLDLFDENSKVNPELLRLEREAARRAPQRGQRNRHDTGGVRLLDRAELVEKLDREGMLPVITFIFSRAGCDAAVKQCLTAGIRLTDTHERSQIREVIAKKTATIPAEDLHILGFSEWSEALERGIAAHHAGILPIFKETVEELFQLGFVKAVFATETLALGINMPARTVLLEKLSKWNGESHVWISPGEFTQLTGRAGRRGIDIEGNEVVQWTRDIDSALVGSLASTRTYPLKSSFKPTYNMTINLIAKFGAIDARASLESSFAQFQADKAVVGLAKQLRKNEKAIAEAEGEIFCHLGDFNEYWSIRFEIKEIERRFAKEKKRKQLILEEELIELRRALRSHPCHACHEREDHARISERTGRLRRESNGLQERIDSRTAVIAKRFDRVRTVLEMYGYLQGEEITEAGYTLSKIYGETDLLIAEAIRSSLFQQLAPSEMVSVISTLVFESRVESEARIPNKKVEYAVKELEKIWFQIHRDEIEVGLEPVRAPDASFCTAAFRWSTGHSLSSILKHGNLTVGDFVRSMKQIIDVLRQIALTSDELAISCEDAIRSVDRGIVSYAGIVA